MNLNELRDEAYRIAINHGWHEEERNDAHWLMLIFCEIAEAVEADRKNRHAEKSAFEHDTMRALRELQLSGEAYDTYESSCFNSYIKDTVEDELADVVIRCLDLAGLRQISLSDNLIPTKYTLEHTKEKTFTEWAYSIADIVVDDFIVTERKITLAILNVIAKSDVMGFDLWWHVKHKMHYNKSRAYKHGKKY